ncbi:hypothetical protein M427DRAFT_28619 [Gonapodya prolifera JEL478]|uniref:Hydrophobin n=1 Tax=Gonapodya prolifera (strain JEL478) TaxID=1344416 RepID=A0A139AT50_GONPJ|nr:hypothetical protein M427DRAFT_28619 [Gonapodya prolifera JEL478]|eukprot:KXS19675.1 hypothetical protein M427DRAFT_28619 [Gonapodya prolifera JEL478]
MRSVRAPSWIALAQIAAAILAALSTYNLVHAQTQADDCRPFETLYRQTGKATPWTVGACCASIHLTCVSGRITAFYSLADGLTGSIPDLSGIRAFDAGPEQQQTHRPHPPAQHTHQTCERASACQSSVLVNDALCTGGAPPPAPTPAPNSSPSSPATKPSSSGTTAGTNDIKDLFIVNK